VDESYCEKSTSNKFVRSANIPCKESTCIFHFSINAFVVVEEVILTVWQLLSFSVVLVYKRVSPKYTKSGQYG